MSQRGGGNEWRGGSNRGGYDGARGGGGRGYDGTRGGGGRGYDGARGGGGRGYDGARGGGGRGYDGARGGGGRGYDGARGGGGRGYDGARGGGGRGYDGGRGDSRGGPTRGRGMSRGRVQPPEFVKTLLPSYTSNDFRSIDNMVGIGWRPYHFKAKENVKLHAYEGPPATESGSLITVSVNHFPLENFRLPRNIYHYEVEMERVRKEPKEEDKKETPKPEEKKGKQKGKMSPDKGKGPPRPGAAGGAGVGPPRKLPKPLPQLILQVLLTKLRALTNNKGIASDDSNNIYATKQLEGNVELTHFVSLTEVDQVILQETDDGVIKVTIVPTNRRIDTTPMADFLSNNGTWRGMDMDVGTKSTLEQTLNAVLKSMHTGRYLSQGRSNLINWPVGSGDSLGSGVVNWRGVSANITMGWKPFVNVCIANCAFSEQRSVISALEEHFRGDVGRVRDWRREDFESAKSFLRNVKVFYKLPNGKIMAGPVTDVLPTSPKDTFFDCQNRKTSVLDYFSRTYNIQLKSPDGPCLLLRGRCQVPAELCHIKKGQSYNRKLDDKQTSNMLYLAKKDPGDLKAEIQEAMNSMKVTQNSILKEWGVNISPELLKLENTRVLAPPKLRYGIGTEENRGKGNAEITPVQGQWEIWNSNFKFFESKDVKTWGILVAGDPQYMRIDSHQIDNFAKQMMSNGRQKGVNFVNPQYVYIEARNLRDDFGSAKKNVEILKNLFSQDFDQCDLVLVIIPKKNCATYAHVKQAAELKTGTLTQCVVAQNVFKGQAATIQNILLKVNSKLGGINHVIVTPNKQPLHAIDIHRCPMLIMGADVTHPPPGTMKRIKGVEVPVPSFAAVTGSIDKTGMPFMMDIRAQTKAGRGAAEVIQGLDSIVEVMLQKFKDMTVSSTSPEGIRPRKIIYYRDGVGEGQFGDVLHTEMLAMRTACEKLTDYDGGKYEPQITFITVQKRHKTRFFYHPSPGNTMQAPAGTVVDKEIVHQTETDFYLLSHKGMMGTSRPTRYHVLWDDSKFTADQIQTLTYYLCYMYVRCNKSVRMPAPTYYAHWAAERAKALTDGLDENFDNLPRLNELMKRHEGMKAFPMHFV